MGKIILMFSIFLAFFFPATIEKELPNGLRGWLTKNSIDKRDLPEREDASVSKNVHKPKLIQESMSDSVPRDHHAPNLSGKVRLKRDFDIVWAILQDCKCCRQRLAAGPVCFVSNLLNDLECTYSLKI